MVEALASLVAKSLVAAEAGDIEVEYRQFDTTRSHALEKLADSNELDNARQRHAAHFLELARLGAAERERSSRAAWLARYGSKVDDIRDALRLVKELREGLKAGHLQHARVLLERQHREHRGSSKRSGHGRALLSGRSALMPSGATVAR